MPNVDIPGIGITAFPDAMSEDAINAAAHRLYSAQRVGSIQSRLPQLRQEAQQAQGAQSVPNQIAQGIKIAPAAAVSGAGELLHGVEPFLRPAEYIGGGLLLNRLMGNKGAAPAEATATPAPAAAPAAVPPKESTGLVRLTQKDIDQHPEFSKFEPDQTVRRSTYEQVKGAAPRPGSVQSRVSPRHAAGPSPTEPTAGPAANPTKTPKWLGGEMSEGGVRHDVPYFSESQAKHVPIEDMPQSHLTNAMQKLGTNSRIGEKGLQNLRDMKIELEYRLQHPQGGVHILPKNEPGSLAARRAEASKIMAEVAPEAEGGMTAAGLAPQLLMGAGSALGDVAGGRPINVMHALGMPTLEEANQAVPSPFPPQPKYGQPGYSGPI
jgi:hypothetical protein